MSDRSRQRGKRGLVTLDTLEFVYTNQTGIIPVFNGHLSGDFDAINRRAYIFLMRRCCGLNNEQIAKAAGISFQRVYLLIKRSRYLVYPSYRAYYDPEFAALYKSIRAQCKLIAGLKESTIKKYKQQGKL